MSTERHVIDRLQTLVAPNAAEYEVVPEHWIHGWDEGLSFCFECAEKKVTELLAEGPEEDLSGCWRLSTGGRLTGGTLPKWS